MKIKTSPVANNVYDAHLFRDTGAGPTAKRGRVT